MDNMPESRKALQHLPDDCKKLPSTWKFLKNAREQNQRVERNWLIYREWLKADEKEEEIASLSERWGLEKGRIVGIIAKQRQDCNIPARYMAEAVAIRDRKVIATCKDFTEYRDELEAQIDHLESLREDGVGTVEVEVVEENRTSSKDSYTGTKTKMLTVNSRMLELKRLVAKSHEDEGQALTNYIPKPPQQVEVKGALLHIQADEEFKEVFNNLAAKAKEVKAVVIENEGEVK